MLVQVQGRRFRKGILVLVQVQGRRFRKGILVLVQVQGQRFRKGILVQVQGRRFRKGILVQVCRLVQVSGSQFLLAWLCRSELELLCRFLAVLSRKG